MKRVKDNPEKTVTKEGVSNLLRQFRKPKTVNQAIDNIFARDCKSGKIENRTWKYYVHLNKLPAMLEREGLIYQIGQEKGETGRMEKIWSSR